MTPDPWNKELFNQRVRCLSQEFGKGAIEIHLPALWNPVDPKGLKVIYSTVSTIQIKVTTTELTLIMEAPEHARY